MLQPLQPLLDPLPFALPLLDAPQDRFRSVGLLEQGRQPVDGGGRLTEIPLQAGELGAVRGRLRAACALEHLRDDLIRLDLGPHLGDERLLDRRGLDVGFPDPVVPGVAVPGLPVGCDEEPGEQVVGGAHARGPRGFVALQACQQRLGLVVGDQRRVRVALDDPFAPGVPAPLPRVFLPAMHVPDGVPGVGQRGPLEMRQRAAGEIDAQRLGQTCAVLPGRAAGEPGGDAAGRGFIGRQPALGHRRAVAHVAGVDSLELVAVGRASAGAVALADILGHAGETFFPAHQAVHLVHGLEHGFENHLGNRVGLREFGEQDLDAEFFAFVAEHLGDVAPAADAAGVVDEDDAPGASTRLEIPQQRLEARPVGVLPGLDRVGVVSDDGEVFCAGQRRQFAALGCQADGAPVLARPDVEGGLFWHDGPGSAARRPRPPG